MELKEFKITVLPLRAKLLNYARKLTDEPEDAEDAVQEVLLKLWNKRLELEQYRSIEAFAMTLTHNICIDMWRCKRNDTLSMRELNKNQRDSCLVRTAPAATGGQRGTAPR